MIREEKWILYALGVIKAVHGGASSIAAVAHEMDGSESYLAKVIATLRRGGLLSAEYELLKPYDQITFSDLLRAQDQAYYSSPIIAELSGHNYTALEIPIAQVLERHGRPSTKS